MRSTFWNTLLIATLIATSIRPSLSAEKLKSCKDAKAKGSCSDIVETGINVCEENQGEKPITAKSLRDAQETKFGKSTNFAELISKYKNTEKSAKSDAKKQKACREATLALRKDCREICDRPASPRGGAVPDDCDQGVEELEKLAKFCKQNEEDAEEIAEMAAHDAAMFGSRVGSGDDNNNGNGGANSSGSTSSGGALGYVPSTQSLGSSNSGGPNLNAFGNDSEAAQKAADSANALLDKMAAKANSGANAGTSGGVEGDSSLAVSSGSSGTKIGTGATGLNSSGANRGPGSEGTSASSKTTEGAPGYMIWGTPSRNVPPAKPVRYND